MKVDNEDYTHQTDKYGVIYRDFELTRSSRTAMGRFMQDLLSVNGQTTCQGQVGQWPPEQQRYVTTDFRLQFRSTDDLDRFHALGYNTTAIERIYLRHYTEIYDDTN